MTEKRKTQAFISYSRKNKAFVRKLNAALDEAGINASLRALELLRQKGQEIARVVANVPGAEDVKLEETISSFERLCAGEFDHFPEQAFFMKGGVDAVVEGVHFDGAFRPEDVGWKALAVNRDERIR